MHVNVTSRKKYFLPWPRVTLYSCRNYHSPNDYRKSRGVVGREYHGGTVGYHRVSLAEWIIGGLQGIIEYHGQEGVGGRDAGETLLSSLSRSDFA